MLDIEVAAAVSPRALIAVYLRLTPTTASSAKAAIHDNLRKPSVISISWGNPEYNWTDQAMTLFDEACQDAAAVGVTVCAAAGDHGSSDVQPNTARNSADFPASSPFVLGCGGTHLEGNGQISSESVWNNHDGWATGGGVSEFFAKPSYPNPARPCRRRRIPEAKWAGACRTSPAMRTATRATACVLTGRRASSAARGARAPFWAGLIALLNQKLGRPVGFFQPALYTLPAGSLAFRDVTVGDNGAYQAKTGWDPCTGLGSPNGTKLLAAL